MSKLLENKQIIHIATEIVVLIGITFYFSSKNKKLSAHIEDLSQRLEDQEDLIQKHEQIIRQLVQTVNNINVSPEKPGNHPKVVSKSAKTSTKSRINKPKRKHVSSCPSPQPTVQHFDDNEEVVEDDEMVSSSLEMVSFSSEDDSDLDAEIADELKELQQQDGLKKRI
jgi:hypothetical protein